MCSILPEDKQGPVLDDIRKISKERRRQRGDRTIVTAATVARSPADGLVGVYRSTSELSVAPIRTADECTAGNGGLKVATGGDLMATVRAARRKQSVSATVVYNPAFFEAPTAAYARPTITTPAATPSRQPLAATVTNPARQPYLHMTPENGFSLRQQPLLSTLSDDEDNGRGRDAATTQL